MVTGLHFYNYKPLNIIQVINFDLPAILFFFIFFFFKFLFYILYGPDIVLEELCHWASLPWQSWRNPSPHYLEKSDPLHWKWRNSIPCLLSSPQKSQKPKTALQQLLEDIAENGEPLIVSDERTANTGEII